MTIIRVSEKGQVTLPAAVRRQLGIGPKSTLYLQVRDGTIVLRPVPSIAQVAGVFRKYADKKPADWPTVREQTQRAIASEVANE